MTSTIYNSAPRVLTVRMDHLTASGTAPSNDPVLTHLRRALRLVDAIDSLNEWPTMEGSVSRSLVDELRAVLLLAAETSPDVAFAEHLALRAEALQTDDYGAAFAFGASRHMSFELLLGPNPPYILPAPPPGLSASLAMPVADPVAEEVPGLDAAVAAFARECISQSPVPARAPSFEPPIYSICDLLAVAGGAATPPYHFAHFLPEDEGLAGATTKTIVYRNLYGMRFFDVSLPLLEILGADVDADSLSAKAPTILLRWMRCHDLAHAYFDDPCLESGLAPRHLHAVREILADTLADTIVLESEDGDVGRHVVLAEKLRCGRRDTDLFADALAARVSIGHLYRAFEDPLRTSAAELARSCRDLIAEILDRLPQASGAGTGAWIEDLAQAFVQPLGNPLVDDIVPLFPSPEALPGNRPIAAATPTGNDR